MVMLGPYTFDAMGIPMKPEWGVYFCDCILPNLSLLFTVLYVVYYLSLSRSVGLLASALVVCLLMAANKFNTAYDGSLTWRVALGAHVFAWAVQFYGHDVHEGACCLLCCCDFMCLVVRECACARRPGLLQACRSG